MIRTVLVVTEAPQIRSAMKSLHSSEVRVLETDSGIAALFVCASQSVDLIAIDLATPGMDWPRFEQKLASRFPDTPMLTIGAGESPGAAAGRVREVLQTAVRKQPASAILPDLDQKRRA